MSRGQVARSAITVQAALSVTLSAFSQDLKLFLLSSSLGIFLNARNLSTNVSDAFSTGVSRMFCLVISLTFRDWLRRTGESLDIAFSFFGVGFPGHGAHPSTMTWKI